MKQDTCSNRLKTAAQLRGFTQSELCEKTNIPKSAMSQYFSGKFEPKQVRTALLAKALAVAEAWLMGYDVPMELAKSAPNTFGFDNVFPMELKQFPLLGEISCGEPIFTAEDHENHIWAGAHIAADFCLKAHGDSMQNARIHHGDIVFIKKQTLVENGEIAAVVIDDTATLKRVYYYPEEKKLSLNAENPAYSPLIYVGEELEHVVILGKAIAFQSDVK